MITAKEAKAIKSAAHRPVSATVPHEDTWTMAGNYLTIGGIRFAIPPRIGAEIAPSFEGGKLSLSVVSPADWPEADALMASAPVKSHRQCEACGQSIESVVQVSDADGMRWLSDLVELACKLLDVVYNISDADKKRLFTFSVGRLPEWMPELLRWAAMKKVAAEVEIEEVPING